MNTKTIKGKTLGIILSLALVLSLAAVALPATPVYAATNYYVDGTLGTDDGSHGTSAGAGAFKTIQYAIDDARVVATDTIIVAAGIYTGDLIINKDITLRSASGKASTTIQLVDGVGIDIQAAGAGCTIGGALNTGFTITPHATATTFGIQLTNAPSGVLISYNTISTVGTASMGISVGDAGATSLTVSNNTFTAEVGDGSIWGPLLVGVTVSNNTFTSSGSATGYAVQFSGVTGTSTISGNTISGYSQGVSIFHGEGTSGLTISGNTISGCTNGIRLGEYKATAGPDGDMTTVTVTGNTLSTNTIGLRVNDGAHVLATYFIIQYNKFTGNTTYGLKNEHGTHDVTAERNWWNSNTGPTHTSNPGGTGDSVSDKVDFTPWLQVVAVTDPAGGACIKGGTSYLVQWTAYSVPSANAAFSVYNGTTWVAAESQGGTFNGAYSTAVSMPAVNSSNCKVKVTISGGGGATYYAESGVFRTDSTAPTVALGAIASCLKGGNTVNLTFSVGDTGSTSLDFVIQYSTTGGTPEGSWTNILPVASFSEAPGTKTKSWTVPSVTSNNCKWRVTATDCAGNPTTTTSSGAFTIDSTAPTAVAVIQPNGGETLTAGGTYSIQWNAIDTPPGNLNYTLKYDTAGGGGGYPNTIAGPFSGAQGTYTYTWAVPGVDSITCRVRVIAEDCATNSTSDDSHADFTIQDTTAPTVTVTSPNGGESWAAGSTQTVSWTANDNVPGNLNIKIYYTFDYPTEQCIWEEPPGGISPQAQGAGSYTTWTVPTPLTNKTTCRVKVEATDAASNVGSDCSDGNFTIAICFLPPTVTLTSPNGGESWQGGTCKTITWTASEPADSTYTLTYVLKYSTNGGSSYPNTIATLSNRDQDSQSFCWAVPTTADTDYRVKVEVTGCGGMASAASTNFAVTTADTNVISETMTLKQGWNLISLELMPTCCPSTNTSCCTGCSYPIEGVMADALSRVYGVYYYTGGASGTWQMWSPGAPSSLTTMTDGKTYWVYVTAGADIPFTYQGRKGPGGGGTPYAAQYTYPAGWNMVGFKSTINQRVQDYLGGTCGTTYDVPLWNWDAASQEWVLPTSRPDCTDDMTPGSGYWVEFNSAHTVDAGGY